MNQRVAGKVVRTPPTAGALIAAREKLADRVDGYRIDVGGERSLAELLAAFYGSPTFFPERCALALIAKPATRDDIAALAAGAQTRFSAWEVEARTTNEIVLRDFMGFTRSWLMAEPYAVNDKPWTRLWFGTSFARGNHGRSAISGLNLTFRLMQPFHDLYSRALLSAAAREWT